MKFDFDFDGDKIATTAAVFCSTVFVVLFAACLWGWVMNIVKLANTDAIPVTVIFVMRVVGVFMAPIGSILGFI